MASKYYFVIKLLRIAFFPPFPFSPRLNPVSGFRVPHPNIAFSPLETVNLFIII
jgi:hypothetical protein